MKKILLALVLGTSLSGCVSEIKSDFKKNEIQNIKQQLDLDESKKQRNIVVFKKLKLSNSDFAFETKSGDKVKNVYFSDIQYINFIEDQDSLKLEEEKMFYLLDDKLSYSSMTEKHYIGELRTDFENIVRKDGTSKESVAVQEVTTDTIKYGFKMDLKRNDTYMYNIKIQISDFIKMNRVDIDDTNFIETPEVSSSTFLFDLETKERGHFIKILNDNAYVLTIIN